MDYSKMGYAYRRKVHTFIDTDSLAVIECNMTRTSSHDKNIVFEMIDAIGYYNYVFVFLPYDS